MHATRRDRLRDRLVDADLDALLVSKTVNVRYLTGFTGSAGSLLVTTAGAVLAVDDRYAEQAADEAPDVERVVTRQGAWLGEHTPPGRLGVESHHLAWDRVREITGFVEAQVVPAPGHVEELRATKDPAEIERIRRACAVTDEAFADLRTWIAPGLTEREIARRLHYALTGLGADDRAFAAIVAGGPHAARPHHQPTDRPLAAGELVKLDFGALVDGYHSDMTRMVALGLPDPELEKVAALVQQAQRAGVAAAVAGAGAAEVDGACREVIAGAGYGERFPHGTGHGVGLEIHERPDVRPEARATLRAGMVITIEPGVYLPGLGGVRIEDTIAVTDAAPDVLTRTSTDLVRL